MDDNFEDPWTVPAVISQDLKAFPFKVYSCSWQTYDWRWKKKTSLRNNSGLAWRAIGISLQHSKPQIGDIPEKNPVKISLRRPVCFELGPICQKKFGSLRILNDINIYQKNQQHHYHNHHCKKPHYHNHHYQNRRYHSHHYVQPPLSQPPRSQPPQPPRSQPPLSQPSLSQPPLQLEYCIRAHRKRIRRVRIQCGLHIFSYTKHIHSVFRIWGTLGWDCQILKLLFIRQVLWVSWDGTWKVAIPLCGWIVEWPLMALWDEIGLCRKTIFHTQN